MPILYKKFQDGGGTPPIYSSVEELSGKPAFKKITLKTNGVTRCLGAGIDACKISGGHDWRQTFGKVGKYDRVKENDWVVDSWDVKNVAKVSNDIDLLYDREKDGDITPEMLENLPAHALIGTGDVRGKYGVRKDYPTRVSRHTIINMGWTQKGKPIIYDLGKFSEGIPEKYLNEINFIAAPKNAKYFPKPEEKKTETKEPSGTHRSIYSLPGMTPGEQDQGRKVQYQAITPSSYGRNVAALIQQVFGGRKYK